MTDSNRTSEGPLRRIIASVNTALDGFMEGPNGEGDLGWLMPFVPDGLADNERLLGEETDAILLAGTPTAASPGSGRRRRASSPTS